MSLWKYPGYSGPNLESQPATKMTTAVLHSENQRTDFSLDCECIRPQKQWIPLHRTGDRWVPPTQPRCWACWECWLCRCFEGSIGIKHLNRSIRYHKSRGPVMIRLGKALFPSKILICDVSFHYEPGCNVEHLRHDFVLSIRRLLILLASLLDCIQCSRVAAERCPYLSN